MWKWIWATLALLVSFAGVLYFFNQYRKKNMEDDPYYMYGDSLYKPEAAHEEVKVSEQIKSTEEMQSRYEEPEEMSSMLH